MLHTPESCTVAAKNSDSKRALMMDPAEVMTLNRATITDYRHVTQCKMTYAKKVLDEARDSSKESIFASSQTIQDLLTVLAYHRKSFHPSGIILHIHDLWSETYFMRGYRYGATYDKQAMTHNLLKPYALFTPEQKAFEDKLGWRDINSIYTLFRQYFARVAPLHHHSLHSQRTAMNKSRLIELVGVLAQDDNFILSLAYMVNENWANTKRGLGYTPLDDVRLAETIENLLGSGDRETLMNNARTDILAVALFIETEL